MRKLVSAIIICSMILGLIPIASAADSTALLNETFNDAVTNSAPSNATVYGDGSLVQAIEERGGKILRLRNRWETAIVHFGFSKGSNNQLVIDAKMRVDDNYSDKALLQYASNAETHSLLTRKKNGIVYDLSGSSVGEIKTGEWVRLTAVMNFETLRYELFMNEKLIVHRGKLNYIDELSRVGFTSQSNPEKETTLCCDYFRVYTGDKVLPEDYFPQAEFNENVRKTSMQHATEPKYKPSLIFSQDCESQTVGQNASGFRIWNGTAAVKRDEADNNLFYRIDYKDGRSAMTGANSQIESYPCFVVQMDVRVDRKSNVSWVFSAKDRATNSNDLRVFNINENGLLVAADEETVISEKSLKGNWVNIAAVTDYRTKDIDYYVDGELAIENFSYANITKAGANKVSPVMHELRINSEVTGIPSEHYLDLDNVYFYKSVVPVDKEVLNGGGSVMQENDALDYVINTDEIKPDMSAFKAIDESVSLQKNYSPFLTDYSDVKKVYKNTICVVADNSNVWVKNAKYGSEYKFLWDGNHIIAPAPTLAAFVNKPLSYNEKEQTVTIGTVKAKVGDKFISVENKEFPSESEVQLIDGIVYIPLREFARYGMNKFYGESTKGFGVIANEEKPYHFNTNPGGGALLSTVADYSHMMAYLVLDRYNADKIQQIFNERIKDTPYPRVLRMKDEAPKIKEATLTDPRMKDFSDLTLGDAKRQIGRTLSIPDMPGGQINGIPSISLPEMMYYAYYMTGDRAYIDKTIEFAEYLINMNYWNGDIHMLSTSWICLYLAYTYDIFHDELTKEQRDAIVNACTEKAIKIHREYISGNQLNAVQNWAEADFNWNVICNAGPMLASMIFLGEGYNDALFLDTIEKAQVSLGYFMHYFSPDGGGWESPGYTNYLLSYMTPLLDGIESYFGEDLGFMNYPGLRDVSTFLVNSTGKENSWAIHCDTDTVPACTALSMWFSKYFKDYEAQQRNIEQLYKNMPQYQINGFTLLKNYMPNPPEVGYKGELDITYRGMQLGTSRDAFGESQQIFMGVHGGYNNDAGMQQDIGNFFLEINGTVFADDTGREDYSLSGSTYPTRPEGHNVWVVNPDESIGQNKIACGKIKLVESKEKGVIYTLDMLPAYYGMVNAATRGYMLSDDRKIFTVQDEIVPMEGTNDFYWFWHSPSEIEIDETNKTATLTQNGQKCTIYFDSNVDFTLSKQEKLEPLPKSPKIEGQLQQTQATKQKKIVVNFFSEGEPVTFRATAVPYGQKYERKALNAIADWSIPDGSTTEGYDNADMIYINGQKLEGFKSNVYDYSMYYPGFYDEPEITVDTKGTVTEIIPRNEKSDTVVIRIAARDYPENIRTYTVRLQGKSCIGLPENAAEHKIIDAQASESDGNIPSNVFDGDLNTRWSSDDDADITLDLGEVKEFNTLAMAIYGGDGRKLDYEIYVSDDNENFTLVADDLLSSGTLSGWEYTQFKRVKARYVKLTCHGSTIIKYNSILELKVLDAPEE